MSTTHLFVESLVIGPGSVTSRRRIARSEQEKIREGAASARQAQAAGRLSVLMDEPGRG